MSPQIMNIVLAALAATAVQAYPQAAPPPPAVDPNFLVSLNTAPTAISRFQKLFTKGGEGKELLPQEELQQRVVFDFNNAPAAGNGGTSKAANVGTFPILTDLGIAATVLELKACGINTPHIHPRATEFLTVVAGPSLNVGTFYENGLTSPGNPAVVTGTVKTLQATVFARGSMHYQFNNNCDSVTAVAVLNDEDPGTLQVAQGFLNMDQEVIDAVIGFPDNVDLASVRKNIPANLAVAAKECAHRCGLTNELHNLGY